MLLSACFMQKRVRDKSILHFFIVCLLAGESNNGCKSVTTRDVIFIKWLSKKTVIPYRAKTKQSKI